MAFWHTGKSDQEMYVGLDDFVYKPEQPVRYLCQSCSQIFNELEKLRQHRFEAHPTKPSILFLHDMRLGSLKVKLPSNHFSCDCEAASAPLAIATNIRPQV